jgi:hypothetical protein
MSQIRCNKYIYCSIYSSYSTNIKFHPTPKCKQGATPSLMTHPVVNALSSLSVMFNGMVERRASHRLSTVR